MNGNGFFSRFVRLRRPASYAVFASRHSRHRHSPRLYAVYPCFLNFGCGISAPGRCGTGEPAPHHAPRSRRYCDWIAMSLPMVRRLIFTPCRRAAA